MKILKLAPYYEPEQVSSTHMNNDLEQAWSEKGIITEVFAPTPTRGISDEVWEQYKKIKYEEKLENWKE